MVLSVGFGRHGAGGFWFYTAFLLSNTLRGVERSTSLTSCNGVWMLPGHRMTLGWMLWCAIHSWSLQSPSKSSHGHVHVLQRSPMNCYKTNPKLLLSGTSPNCRGGFHSKFRMNHPHSNPHTYTHQHTTSQRVRMPATHSFKCIPIIPKNFGAF